VCHVQPTGIVKDATFTVDPDDIKLSDLTLAPGKLVVPRQHISVCYQMDVYIVSFKPNSKQRSRYYILTPRYFMPSTYNLFLQNPHQCEECVNVFGDLKKTGKKQRFSKVE